MCYSLYVYCRREYEKSYYFYFVYFSNENVLVGGYQNTNPYATLKSNIFENKAVTITECPTYEKCTKKKERPVCEQTKCPKIESNFINVKKREE